MKSISNRLKKIATAICLVNICSYASAIEINPPKLDNAAYVLMDYDTGTILAQKNSETPLAPASLTKLMTSYIIEQKLTSGELKENDKVIMSKKAWCGGGGSESCMFVEVNKSATVLQMLKGIVIQSGNDAAVAMAEHISGDEASFAQIMNSEAKKLGMTNSHFVNSTGMPAIGHEASAKDLALLARAIINKGGKYYDIYSEKEFTFNNIKQGNRNTLLLTDSTIDGLKTGHTNLAGYCLVASGKRDGMRLISIIMGAKSMQQRADQSRTLLNWGYGHFSTVMAAPKNQFVAKAPIMGGTQNEIDVVAGDNLSILTVKNKNNKIDTVINIDKEIKAPISKGQPVGKMMAVVAGKTVASVDIVASEDVEQANIAKRTWQQLVYWVKSFF